MTGAFCAKHLKGRWRQKAPVTFFQRQVDVKVFTIRILCQWTCKYPVKFALFPLFLAWFLFSDCDECRSVADNPIRRKFLFSNNLC